MMEDLDNFKSDNILWGKTFLWIKCGMGIKGVTFQIGTIDLDIYANMLLL